MPCSRSSSSWAGTSRRARIAGVDRVVEGLDLAADDRARPAVSSETERDLDALAGEVLAGPVGREDLDAERQETARERDDAIAVRH